MSTHIYIPRTFAYAAGARVREVTCERCGCGYRYRMVRRADGIAFGDGSAAREAATRRAQGKLAKRLEADQDPVACPECGWFQAEMARQHAHVRASGLYVIQSLGWGLVLLSGCMLFFVAAEATDLFHKPLSLGGPSGLKSSAYVSAAIGVALLLIYLPLNWRRRLNTGRSPRGPLAGMPKALRREEMSPDPPAAIYDSEAIHDDGWLTVQLLDLRFPPLCAACLDPTGETALVSRPFFFLSIEVPYCAACRATAKSAKLRAAIVTGIALGAASGVLWLIGAREGLEAGGLALGCGLGAVVGAMAGWAAAKWWHRPVRFRRFRHLRNVIDIRCTNSQYTPHAIRANTAAEAQDAQDAR